MQDLIISVRSAGEVYPPAGVDADNRTITSSDTVLGLEHLPRTMAVVGAGVIGIECASMVAALGVQVTVIDQRPRPLEFLDDEIVDELIHQMRRSDVIFRCGDAVEKVDIVKSPYRGHRLARVPDRITSLAVCRQRLDRSRH